MPRFLLALFVLVLVGCGAPPAPTSAIVMYRVTREGYAFDADVTYKNAQGGTEQARVSLPWEWRDTMQSGAFAYISAQNQSDSANSGVTCEILVDGVVVRTSTSRGPYTICTASGKL